MSNRAPHVQERPGEIWLLAVKWKDGKPLGARGGGIFRSKESALARRRLLRRRWGDRLLRATLFRTETTWIEVPEWWDDAK